MFPETHDMKADVCNLLTLIKRQSSSLYSEICDDNVLDYLENNECQLAVELLTFKGEAIIDQLSAEVLEAIVRIIQSYDLYKFSDDPKISSRYDKFVHVAKAKRS